MIKPIEGQHYFIKDLGDKVELTSTLFHGLIAGCIKLAAEQYNIIYDSCMMKGNMYIIPAEKPTEEYLSEFNELQQKVEELVKENRYQKSLLARYKNKIEKLEKMQERVNESKKEENEIKE
jgi:hypothetical protein